MTSYERLYWRNLDRPGPPAGERCDWFVQRQVDRSVGTVSQQATRVSHEGPLVPPPLEQLAGREGVHPLAVRDPGTGRVLALLVVELVTPDGILEGTLADDGRSLVAAECEVVPYLDGPPVPVISLAWVDPAHRGQGLGAWMIRDACDLIGTTPAEATYQLPFTPGGRSLVRRVAGRRFRGAIADLQAVTVPLAAAGSLVGADRTGDEEPTTGPLRQVGTRYYLMPDLVAVIGEAAHRAVGELAGSASVPELYTLAVRSLLAMTDALRMPEHEDEDDRASRDLVESRARHHLAAVLDAHDGF